jgi:hypothetical protein
MLDDIRARLPDKAGLERVADVGCGAVFGAIERIACRRKTMAGAALIH